MTQRKSRNSYIINGGSIWFHSEVNIFKFRVFFLIKSSEFDVAKGCLPQRSRVLQTVVTRLKLMVQLQSLSSMIVTLAISLDHRSFFSFSFQMLNLIRLDEGKGFTYISSFSGSQVCAHAATLIRISPV